MKSYTLTTLWMKTGDGRPHQRKRSVSVEVPVEGDATEIKDALLSLPWADRDGIGESWTVRLAAPREALTDDDVLEMAIPQAQREMGAKARKEAEKKEAGLAEERVRLATFACGGDAPGHPLTERRAIDWLVSALHHNLAKVAVKHIVVSHGDEALEGHDELRAQVEARMEGINAGARERAEAEMAAKEAVQTERERLNAEKEATKQERADARAAEIAAWAAEHGSNRLCEQIKQGLDGWPLYLHERLEADWPASVLGSVRAELDNDGETGDSLVNPITEQLYLARAVGQHAVELGLCETVGYRQIEIVPIEFAIDDEDELVERRIYVTFSGYRPGSEAFAVKTIRFACEE